MSHVTRKLLSRNINKANGDGKSTETCDLDEEMEKVFAMSESDKFDFSRFTADDSEKKTHQRYNEREINSTHRRRSYPHIHLPLKGLNKFHSSRRAKYGKSNYGNKKKPGTSKEVDNTRHEVVSKAEKESLVSYENSSKDPASSYRTAHAITDEEASAHKHVQFNIGNKDSGESSPHHVTNVTDDGHKSSHDLKLKRKHSGHHHKKTKKYIVNGKDGARKSSVVGNDQEDGSYQLILQLEEPLHGFVQDDLESHRCYSTRDKRRFSTKSSISSVLDKRNAETSVISSLPINVYKKNYDHSPHEVFVQLDELIGVGEDREWKETARWIKYEEDVEEGADRWGKPHVASLSFHSLLNLRRCIETGVVLLDLEEKELPGVAYRIVEQMVIDQVIKEEEKATVIRALLSRHRPVCELERFRFMQRNTASYTSLQGLDEMNSDQAAFATRNNLPGDQKSKSKLIVNGKDISKIDGTKPKEVSIDMKEETYTSSSEELDRKIQKEKESILRRIPGGAEATTVLVGTVDFLQEPAIAFVRLAEAILLPAVTEVSIPVRFMFILLGPLKTDVDYHEIGRSMSTLMSNTDFHEEAYKATDRRDLLRAINEFLDYSIVLPPDNWERNALLSLRELRAKNEVIRKRRNFLRQEANANKALLVSSVEKKKDDDPLRRTKKCFGGLINDIKRRVPYYKSDFIDGLNYQCVSASLFMFFAALSAAITFGGLFAKKTMRKIGISETLIATSLSGIFFGLLSSQPLMIIGTTGPLLLFDESLFKFCTECNIDYLTMRLYIGFWIVIIALVVASFEGSVFIKVFTRFTEEIFATLISLIYIVESVTNLISLFFKHPLMDARAYCEYSNSSHFDGSAPSIDAAPMNKPNTALFCMILSLGTFFLAYYLRHFRNSKFLGRSVRRAVGDFGVPIAIVVFGILDVINPTTFTEKLSVPQGLQPSEPNRTWVISPAGPENNGFPKWAMMAAILPAFLVYILVFMETNISELIIGKKERKLKKGNGFHLDIVLVCLTNAGCGMVGAPWMCAATVRSVTHVNSVTVMSTTHAPGEKPHIIQVREQRVSALITSALVGVSVFMAPILRYLPMAVLFGVFLYMGISSIQGIQFLERVVLFLMPVKHHPQTAYVRKVPTYKMYLFTLIQLLCVIILWTIKSSPLSLLFPFFLLLLVPLRAQLVRFFSPAELRALDSDEPDAMDKEDDEPDFYAESLLPG